MIKATESVINAATKHLHDELDEHKKKIEEQEETIRSLEKQLNVVQGVN